jgi:hypothetical protein
MDASDAIALLALGISVWAAVTSHRAHNHALRVHELETDLAFRREKSELLSYLEQSRNLFASARREIELARYVLDQEPLQVQAAMGSYQSLFTEFLPNIVGAERQVNSLWSEIYEWRDQSGRSAFAHHVPRYRALVENDRVAHEMALKCTAEFNETLGRARQAYNSGQLG